MHESNQNIQIRCIDPFENIDKTQSIWLDLQGRSEHSFFTSWGWIGTWLSSLPRDLSVKLVVGYIEDMPVSCGVVVERSSIQNWLFYKNRAYLNATGDRELDALMIEYNGFLWDDRVAETSAMLTCPELKQVEEFHLPGVFGTNDPPTYFDNSFFVRIDTTEPSHFVDLDDVRSRGEPYLGHLSANRRRQIRRSIRQLEELGTIRITEAASVAEALRMLEGLAEYHQTEWVARGEHGAFSSEFFFDFHRQLINRRFGEGEIQLLEICAGETVIGYLYSFVYKRQVLFYQSGFNYEDARELRPGVVSHYFAIEHNLKKGVGKYNFLAGDAQYKRSFATGHDTLHWIVASRKNMKSRFERVLMEAKRRLDRLRRGNR